MSRILSNLYSRILLHIAVLSCFDQSNISHITYKTVTHEDLRNAILRSYVKNSGTILLSGLQKMGALCL